MEDESESSESKKADRFPLSLVDLSQITLVIRFIRTQLAEMEPRHLRSAAALLRALESLPAETPGMQLTFGFVQKSSPGNYGWADVSFSDGEFRLGTGEHFYDQEVGGDTESRTVFQAHVGANSAKGSVSDWLETAQVIAASGEIDVEDETEYDAIDWTGDTERDELGNLEPPP
jgi:hypothetical protein